MGERYSIHMNRLDISQFHKDKSKLWQQRKVQYLNTLLTDGKTTYASISSL